MALAGGRIAPDKFRVGGAHGSAATTFGGAYAVLPYVYQGAVEHYGWLTPVQMIDGLALGETTPGPLIMVVAFVGFVGGYAKAALGPDSLFLAGAVAAAVVTWFTFLPSFLFILAGGPLVEHTHGDLKVTAPSLPSPPPSSASSSTSRSSSATTTSGPRASPATSTGPPLSSPSAPPSLYSATSAM